MYNSRAIKVLQSENFVSFLKNVCLIFLILPMIETDNFSSPELISQKKLFKFLIDFFFSCSASSCIFIQPAVDTQNNLPCLLVTALQNLLLCPF